MNVIKRIQYNQNLPKVDDRYYQIYQEQLEMFHLLNDRGHLFFGSAGC